MSDDTGAPAPLEKFSWPFPKADTSAAGAPSSEVTDPRDYYEALALAEDGFYPIGANGQWHGGIHFGRQTGDRLDQNNGIGCIADGEVIAWKIDETYPTVEYDTCGTAKYSTGFVLVRHRLALPAAPAGEDAGDGEQATGHPGQDDADEPSLLFYSLYIHLLDWQGYQQSPDTPRPDFWGEGTYLVGDGANDSEATNRQPNPHLPPGGVGLNLRNAANVVVGFAPRGTQLRLGERRGTSGYYAVTEVVGGSVVPPGLTDFYAFRDEMTAVPAEPATKGSVVIPESPIPIAAGALVGHLGEYKRYIDAGALCSDDPRPLAQIDVFTTDDIEAFIQASRARAAQLPDSSKTLLVVESGAQLAIPAGGGETPSAEQLTAARGTGSGPVAGHTRVIPIKALDAVTEEDGTRWWPVDVGTQGGETANGWVRERDHANVRLASPWEWPGFEIVRVDDTRPDQFYAHRVVQEGHATPDEQGALEQRGGAADSGSIFRKLYDTLDDSGDKKITADEIRRALQKTWLAQALSHLIVEHESEWSGPMAKWDAIDELIPENRKKDWAKEKERIESLLWWPSAKGQNGLVSDESLIAYNFHATGILSNFSTPPCSCHRDLTENELREIIVAMRRSEPAVHASVADRLFTANNTLIPDEDKNYRRLTEEINSAFNLFGINTCIRRIHFLAQAYWEADRLRTTKEYGTGHRYAPYVGRGLMQLTWESGYEKYESYSGLGCVAEPDLVSDSLHHSVLSAAWYWNQGKELSIGTTWRAPASAPEYVRRHNPSYSKRTITYAYGGARKNYGTIDLNHVADDDHVDVISWLVNGGSNGLTERQVYVSRLKEIMDYDSSCINKR